MAHNAPINAATRIGLDGLGIARLVTRDGG